MEKNVDEAARARNAARGAMVAEREARREGRSALSEMTTLHPNSRIARRSSALMLDVERFDDWVAEQGGDDGFMRWFCAQIAAGVPAKVLCQHYVVDDGLLGEYLTAEPSRMERYYRAQRWVADGFVAEAVGIADEDNPDVVRDKLRVDTRLKVAGKLDRQRFGEEKQAGVPGVPVINFIMPPALGAPLGQVLDGGTLPPVITQEKFDEIQADSTDAGR